MTYATDMPSDLSFYDPDRSWRLVSPQALFGAVALASSICLGAFILDIYRPVAPGVERTDVFAAPGANPTPAIVSAVSGKAPAGAFAATGHDQAPTLVSAAASVERVPAPVPETIIAAKPDRALLDPAYTSGATSDSFGQTALLGRDFAPTPSATPAAMAQRNDVAPTLPAAMAQLHDVAGSPPALVAKPGSVAPEQLLTPSTPQIAESIPLPAPRPPAFRLQASQGPFRMFGRRLAQRSRPTAVATVPVDDRNFIEKLFGMPQPPAPVLGYAAPEVGLFGGLRAFTPGPALPYDRWTAVYDIAAHTVYMPNGARLEAHSGLGQRLDDPRSVSLHDRGATPPAVYDLQPREALFHGVQALRLNPVGGATFGRTGLLAHTYMLGPNGDSNGCVSFKDYSAFLQAYMNGEVRRLAVVTRRI